MSECAGSGCTHPEHAGDHMAAAWAKRRAAERQQLLALFAPEKLAMMNRAERRAALRGRR